MPRFLHVADVHLGFDRYDNKRRTMDFFYAFQDALERYAIANPVDFVLIVGDLFEHRNIQPNILNQAQVCLQALKDAGIPVLAIEGNHDNRPYGARTSWLRYLADWEMLKLLEPGDISAGEPFYFPWDEEEKRGGYIDLDCGIRVLGSAWYGAMAPQAIAQTAEAIQALPSGPGSTVMMFHHGLEGQIARYQGALRYKDLLPLKEAGVDYLALGHIHKNYTYGDWIFNPGSIEANSVEEVDFERGVYLVNIDGAGIQAELQSDYIQRPVVRLHCKVTESDETEQVVETARSVVQSAIERQAVRLDEEPIVELRISGYLGFNRLDLDTRRLQAELQELSQALIFLLKFEAEQREYTTQVAEGSDRQTIEREVFLDLLAANATYRKRSPELAQGLIDLKDLQLSDRPETELYSFVEALLAGESAATDEGTANDPMAEPELN